MDGRREFSFDAMYAGTPPWDIGRPQGAFARLADAGALHGRVLDVGCGTGEHALLAASLGLDAAGVDLSPTAIETARRKATERNLTVDFRVSDALDLPSLGMDFDTVLDSGVFHVFDDDDRVRFADSLRAVLVPGGRYFMLCFSDLVPGDLGPRRVSREEIRSSFEDGWRIVAIEPATMELTFSQDGIPAWLATIARVNVP